MSDSPLFPASSTRYSFGWAYSIICRLKESRGRATNYVEWILDVTDRQLAYYLANEPEIWRGLKRLIQQCDRWIQTQDRCNPIPDWVPDVESFYAQVKRFNLPERLEDHLTKQKKQRILEEQEKRTGGLAFGPAPQPLSSSPGGSDAS